VVNLRLEWMRANDHTDTNWACFLVFDDHADVLAVISRSERVDRRMSHDDARVLWAGLLERGWHRASEDELQRFQMSHRELRRIAYGRR
jgi:hypothetical protein